MSMQHKAENQWRQRQSEQKAQKLQSSRKSHQPQRKTAAMKRTVLLKRLSWGSGKFGGKVGGTYPGEANAFPRPPGGFKTEIRDPFHAQILGSRMNHEKHMAHLANMLCSNVVYVVPTSEILEYSAIMTRLEPKILHMLF